jgi:trk system potassium uptake protein
LGKNHEGTVLVVGLGRFGGSIAGTLERLGHEVLAVDQSLELVQEWSTRLRHVAQVDATNESAMRQLGADQFDIAVVGIGDDIEASVLSTGVLLDLGVHEVWAKAITPAHGRILERSGARHVIYPERDAGERTAHLLSGRLMDYIEFDDGFAIVKMKAPREATGKTLGEAALRTKYGVTIVGVKRAGEDFAHAVPETPIRPGDVLIVSGASHLIEKFAAEAG